MKIVFKTRDPIRSTYAFKFSFTVSDIDSLDDFLDQFIEIVASMKIFNLTEDSKIGFEIYSNITLDSPPIYIPLRSRESINNDLFIHRLQKISQSTSIFIDLDIPFEVVVAVLEL